MSLTQDVKAEARRLGFQLVGVTAPDPPLHLTVFEDWLRAGRHAEMGYLATERSRQRRADPKLILPDCCSILVLGVRYPAPTGAIPEPSRGLLAAYAWGKDYHEVLPDRLGALVAFIEAKVGKPVPNRWYTDTGPILERDLAQKAGLGWIGKNTCLINPRQGSYFLLAEILLGVALDHDRPFVADYCGACTRCLEACPTACILPDRTLDASRCISYLTIELKGGIPPDLRPKMGAWIFGCDVCQQVCPWNLRFAAPQGDADFEPPAGDDTVESAPQASLPHPDLLQELELSATAFNSKYRGSPIKRAKRRGYLRNVVVALANAAGMNLDQKNRVVHLLSQILFQEAEPLVRGHAAWALAEIGGDIARRFLRQAAQEETDESVLIEIQLANMRL